MPRKLWKLSIIVEAIFFIRKFGFLENYPWYEKNHKPILEKCVCFKTKLELDGSEHLELPVVTKGHLRTGTRSRPCREFESSSNRLQYTDDH